MARRPPQKKPMAVGCALASEMEVQLKLYLFMYPTPYEIAPSCLRFAGQRWPTSITPSSSLQLFLSPFSSIPCFPPSWAIHTKQGNVVGQVNPCISRGLTRMNMCKDKFTWFRKSHPSSRETSAPASAALTSVTSLATASTPPSRTTSVSLPVLSGSSSSTAGS